MKYKTIKDWEKEFNRTFAIMPGEEIVTFGVEGLKQFIESALDHQKKELIEEIIVWSRTHHTGSIDELYEVPLSDLLRFIESKK